jgi:heterodisulfide reductase subunit A-like polyferredoxin
MVNSKLVSLQGKAGNFQAKIIKHHGYIDEKECTGCSDCAQACPVEVPNEFELNLNKRKAVFRAFDQAVPNIFRIDKRGVSPCRVACPADVNAHAYVALIAQGKYEEALEIVRQENPFPAVCGRICTHPCESDCTRNEVDEPIAICTLKRFIADYEKESINKGKSNGAPLPEIKEKKEEKVAIVGSGPAGLTAAYYLAMEGYQVTVFEALSVVGGMLYTCIPAFRLPREIIEADVERIRKLGVEIKTNTTIGKELSLEELKKQGYKAIFIAIGAHQGLKLGVPGEDDYEGLLDCITFLRQVNLGDKTKPGNKVIVIGGGNSAIDSARTALRLGCEEVHILYRRSRKEMPAYEEEVEEAEHEGVQIHYLAAPVKILGKKGKVTGMECIKMKLGEPDASGRRRPLPIEGSEFTIEADCIIPAISQQPDLAPFGKDHTFKLTRWNTFEVDPNTLQTNIPGIYAGGDAVSGPATVIEAIAAGKKVARSIDRYLRGEPPLQDVEETAPIAKPIIDKKTAKSARRKGATIPLEKRKGSFDEVNLGFTEEEAKAEADRCLNCSVCCECLQCEAACQKGAIDHNMAKESIIDLDSNAIIIATGFEMFDPTPLSAYGYGRLKNVVTSMEYERLESASGPTGGHLIRPSDGKEPQEIAFIQCVGSRDTGNYSFCSSVCCMHATKQAILASEHYPDCKCHIFYTELRAFGKGFHEYTQRAKKDYGVNYIRSRVPKITEDENSNPIIWYEDTTTRKVTQKKVNLVVLNVSLIPHSDVWELASILGVKLDENNFFETKPEDPVSLSKEGIYVCGYCQEPKDIPESVAQASAAASRATEIIFREALWKKQG